MNISVIIPFYKGEKYVSQLLTSLKQSYLKYKKKTSYDIELIVINDYPRDFNKIKSLFVSDDISIRVVNNTMNIGIQASRIKGLKYAIYEYILFLDQDDIINENYFINQFKNLKEADVVICNGIYEEENSQKIIYKSKRSMKYATKEIGYLKVRNLIVSPGQCIIKKNKIPEFWKKNIMKINCSDDYFLWLLMFNENCKFSYNYSVDYIHKFTGKNLSNNPHHVHQSNQEMIELLRNNNRYSFRKNKLLERSVYFKYDLYKGDRILNCLRNLDLFIYNCLYQCIWKGM